MIALEKNSCKICSFNTNIQQPNDAHTFAQQNNQQTDEIVFPLMMVELYSRLKSENKDFAFSPIRTGENWLIGRCTFKVIFPIIQSEDSLIYPYSNPLLALNHLHRLENQIFCFVK